MKNKACPLVIAFMITAILFEGYTIKEDISGMFAGGAVEETGETYVKGETLADINAAMERESFVEPEPEPEFEDPGKVKVIPERKMITKLVPTVTAVDDSYFDDALFIGDSRIEGLCEYGGLDNATYYYKTGLNVFKLFEKGVVPVEGSKQKALLEDGLKEHSYGKIYIMIGLNEMGIGDLETFTAAYADAIARIEEYQPDAIIYIQSIMKVTGKKSKRDKTFKNERIDERNAAISALADGERVFYIDVNEPFVDENGDLTAGLSGDGVHLYSKYYPLWTDYLRNNAVVFFEEQVVEEDADDAICAKGQDESNISDSSEEAD